MHLTELSLNKTKYEGNNAEILNTMDDDKDAKPNDKQSPFPQSNIPSFSGETEVKTTESVQKPSRPPIQRRETVHTSTGFNETINASGVLGEPSKSKGSVWGTSMMPFNIPKPKIKRRETVAVISFSQADVYKCCNINPYLKPYRNGLHPRDNAEQSEQSNEKSEDKQIKNRNKVKKEPEGQKRQNNDKRRSKSCVIL